MKAEILEYYPNGCLKHKICHHENGCKRHESFYDEYGRYHREDDLPAYQLWDENERLYYKEYQIHGIFHNIHNPVCICFLPNKKIYFKKYSISDNSQSKLNWMNIIKNI